MERFSQAYYCNEELGAEEKRLLLHCRFFLILKRSFAKTGSGHTNGMKLRQI